MASTNPTPSAVVSPSRGGLTYARTRRRRRGEDQLLPPTDGNRPQSFVRRQQDEDVKHGSSIPVSTVMETGVSSSSAAEEVKLPTDMPCSCHQSEVEEVERRGNQLRKPKGTRVKRKKHRPKVVQEEGWSMKTKPVTPAQVTPKPVRKYGNRTAETSHERKNNGLNSVQTPSYMTIGISIEVGKYSNQNVENRTNSTRRRLNFKSEDSSSVANSTMQIGRGMEDVMENPTAGITFHLDQSQVMEEHIRLPPSRSSRSALLMRNRMILAENDREGSGAKRRHGFQTGDVHPTSSNTRCTQEDKVWQQRSNHGQSLCFAQVYKKKRKRRKAQDKECKLLMQDSCRDSESVFVDDRLLQALGKRPQSDNYIDIQIKEHPKTGQVTGGIYRFFEQKSVGLAASAGYSQENNLGHSISDSIISNSEEPEPQHCTDAMSQAIVPCAHRTEDAFSQDVRLEAPNALVSYGGRFDEVKKRRPRAKVDLDEESNRMRNVLMGKEVSVGEESDVGEKKHWENERLLFCGRVYSFIARMQLVQGDRRFSQWKGSVLDSVAGVFLTQNVSDILSSSAFMSLVAKFPSRDNDADCNAERMQQDGSIPPSNDTGAKTKTNNKVNSNKLHGKKKDSKGFHWDSLRKEACCNGYKLKTTDENRDSLDWEAVRCADVKNISEAIRERGQNNILAGRIKDFLYRIFREHGSLDLEWLRYVSPDKAKDFLLSIQGLGLKSVECVRLLALNQLAFPVDTNVARVCVRLGWVPIQPLPGKLELHLLELYPMMENIQKYLWPRLCKLDQRTLYELHYQMITFGKVFCTKRKPKCNSCPMKGECRHYASAYASAMHALPGPSENGSNSSAAPTANENDHKLITFPQPQNEGIISSESVTNNYVPRIQVPSMPRIEEPSTHKSECTPLLEIDIEDAFCEDPYDISALNINLEEFRMNLKNYMEENMEFQHEEMTKFMVATSREVASIPNCKLKHASSPRNRTSCVDLKPFNPFMGFEILGYELPDSHPLLEGLDRREPNDPCPYLLSIWTPGETAKSTEPPETCCNFQDIGKLCEDNACFSCSSRQEEQAQIVKGTLLIPCRTATKGRFPLNGTYFQVNEVFADHETSYNPIDVPSKSIWNLPRRSVYMGGSTRAIFRGQPLEKILVCFGTGFICMRGFDRITRSPRSLCRRFLNLGRQAPKGQKERAKEAKQPVKKKQAERRT